MRVCLIKKIVHTAVSGLNSTREKYYSYSYSGWYNNLFNPPSGSKGKLNTYIYDNIS